MDISTTIAPPFAERWRQSFGEVAHRGTFVVVIAIALVISALLVASDLTDRVPIGTTSGRVLMVLVILPAAWSATALGHATVTAAGGPAWLRALVVLLSASAAASVLVVGAALLRTGELVAAGALPDKLLPASFIGAACLMGYAGALAWHQSRRLRAQWQAAATEGQALRASLAEAELLSLQAQIEPHFLFNTLAHIKWQYSVQAERGTRMLDDLVDYLTRLQPGARRPTLVLAHELDLVRAYLKIVAIRLGPRFHWTLEATPEAQAATVPTMSVLSLVENAVKHGLSKVSGAVELEVDCGVLDGTLLVRVRDTGAGLQPGSGSNIGLSNLKARLLLSFGPQAHLRLRNQPPRGVEATLSVPIRRASEHHVAVAEGQTDAPDQATGLASFPAPDAAIRASKHASTHALIHASTSAATPAATSAATRAAGPAAAFAATFDGQAAVVVDAPTTQPPPAAADAFRLRVTLLLTAALSAFMAFLHAAEQWTRAPAPPQAFDLSYVLYGMSYPVVLAVLNVIAYLLLRPLPMARRAPGWTLTLAVVLSVAVTMLTVAPAAAALGVTTYIDPADRPGLALDFLLWQAADLLTAGGLGALIVELAARRRQLQDRLGEALARNAALRHQRAHAPLLALRARMAPEFVLRRLVAIRGLYACDAIAADIALDRLIAYLRSAANSYGSAHDLLAELQLAGAYVAARADSADGTDSAARWAHQLDAALLARPARPTAILEPVRHVLQAAPGATLRVTACVTACASETAANAGTDVSADTNASTPLALHVQRLNADAARIAEALRALGLRARGESSTDQLTVELADVWSDCPAR